MPLLLLTGLAATWVVARAVPLRFPVTTVVVGYAALRLAIAAGLMALGRSTPDLPIAVLGLAAFDLPLRNTALRVIAAVTATSALALGASASGLASPVTIDVAIVAVPLLVVGVLTLLPLNAAAARPRAAVPRRHRRVGPASRASKRPRSGTGRASSQQPHDGRIGRRRAGDRHRQAWRPLRRPGAAVGRGCRAGEYISSPLEEVGQCTFRGAVTLPEDGRWFVYSEFTHDGRAVEGWLPLEVGESGRVQATRQLYLPAGEGVGINAAQIILGGLIYALGIALVALGVRATRSSRMVATQARDATLGFPA